MPILYSKILYFLPRSLINYLTKHLLLFVTAPEIVAYVPVTIASDMWSIGVITYVLISGFSPFMGDNDMQTINNVSRGIYDFEDDEDDDDGIFKSLSDEIKQFIEELLVLNPRLVTHEQT